MQSADDDETLNDRITIRITKEERAGAEWLAAQQQDDLRRLGVPRAKVGAAQVMRDALNERLRAKGWNPEKHMPPAAPPPTKGKPASRKRGA